MLHYLVLEPLRARSAALGWWRFWQIMQDRTNGLLNESFVKVASLWRPRLAAPASPMLPEPARSRAVADLKQDGCAVLPCRLSDENLAALRRFAFSTPAYTDVGSAPVTIREDAIPTSHARYDWRIADLIADPTIQKLVLEGPFWSIAQDYLGCRPRLSSVTMWLNPSYAGANDQFDYHFDNDGPKFLKFFFYLTDMQIGTGAHYFIKGTHGPRKPAAFARSTRCDQDALIAHYGKAREFVAAGPAGTILAEDTMGFHRGSAITSGYRLIMQIQYSVIDITSKEDITRTYTPVAVPGLAPGLSKINAKFWTTAR